MWVRAGKLVPWLAGSFVFHGVFLASVWHARVPELEAVPPRLVLQILPALTGRAEGGVPVPEPVLAPGPLQRPILRPPPMRLDADALLPGPFPIVDGPVRAVLAQPVLPEVHLPDDALSTADPLSLASREPPAPLLD